MTEAEWLAAADPDPMLAFLEGGASDRKLRLFGCACCARLPADPGADPAADQLTRWAIDLAERYADGVATEEERRAGYDALLGVMGCTPAGVGDGRVDFASPDGWATPYLAPAIILQGDGDGLVNGLTGRLLAAGTPAARVTRLSRQCKWAARAAGDGVADGGGLLNRLVRSLRRGRRADPGVAELAAQAGLLRHIFGNPFRPPTADPRWLTSTAVGLAGRVYDGRDFADLPILADALEDAG